MLNIKFSPILTLIQENIKMKFAKKFIALWLVLASLCSSAHLNAQEYSIDTGGYCYEDCRRAPCITPAIALGAVALVAIIAVAIQNSNNGSGHCH